MCKETSAPSGVYVKKLVHRVVCVKKLVHRVVFNVVQVINVKCVPEREVQRLEMFLLSSTLVS